MKKIVVFVALITVFGTLTSFWHFSKVETIKAQSTQAQGGELEARDASVQIEKLERADAEVKTILSAIKERVQSQLRGYKLKREQISTARSAAVGKRGQTGISAGWTYEGTQIYIEVHFFFNEDEARKMYNRSLNFIEMGDFLPPPIQLGDGAVLVENRTYNKTMTEVGLHFLRARAMISAHVSNYKHSTEKNEKELVRFVQVIEPLIRPKSNFDEL